MTKMTKPLEREIIDDFAREISQRKEPTNTNEIIPFRNDERLNKARPVYMVNTELLRFRKDNGRIASEVKSYQELKHTLDESDKKTQELLAGFLSSKDKEETKELTQSLKRDGQRQPAIITCDGFLINGNRRKMALDALYKSTKDETYRSMKVVILPGKDDEGGPPTLVEIEEIENRCQLQKEGKAEYSLFDQALSIKRKIDEMGMDLESLLKDDSKYYDLPPRAFKLAVARFKRNYLDPLRYVDDYLESIGSPGLYSLISQGEKGGEGRWQAFIDYSNYVERKFQDDKQRVELGLEVDEYGSIKDIAFKIIRLRDFPGLPKLHEIVRKYPKMLKDPKAKKELLALSHIDMPPPSIVGGEIEDTDWSSRHRTDIIRQVKKAMNHITHDAVREKPIEILEDILEKLQGDDVSPENINMEELPKARRLAEKIRDAADELKKECWSIEKNNSPRKIDKKLANKFRVR